MLERFLLLSVSRVGLVPNGGYSCMSTQRLNHPTQDAILIFIRDADRLVLCSDQLDAAMAEAVSSHIVLELRALWWAENLFPVSPKPNGSYNFTEWTETDV